MQNNKKTSRTKIKGDRKMKLLCIEDGSVDIDSLEEDLAYCQEKN